MRIFLSLLTGTFIISASAQAADMDAPIFGNPAPQPIGQQAMASDVKGYVEGRFNYAQTDEFNTDPQTWSIRGAVNVPTAGHWNLQFDGGYSYASAESNHLDRVAGALHTYVREGNYAIGAIFDLQYSGDSTASLTEYLAGGEAAYFMDSATVYGQATAGRVVSGGRSVTSYDGKLGGRFYATDNVRFDLEGAIKSWQGSGGTANQYSVAAVGNYRPENMPFSVFGGYRYHQIDVDTLTLAGNVDTNNYFAGLRYHFGSTSLKDEERSGPLWSTLDLVE